MYQCEVKRPFKMKNGTKQLRWVVRDVAGLPSGSHPDIRCMHCHGAVRVHRQQAEDGPADHVEHLSHQDSVGCQGGHFFAGTHRLSLNPVV